jgi:hypothetical protein
VCLLLLMLELLELNSDFAVCLDALLPIQENELDRILQEGLRTKLQCGCVSRVCRHVWCGWAQGLLQTFRLPELPLQCSS